MFNLKQLKKDLERLLSKTSCGNQHLLDLNKQILSDINNLLWSIDEDEEALKTRGYDKLKAISVIDHFFFESEYEVGDTKKYACGLVNYLNKQGYTIVSKK